MSLTSPSAFLADRLSELDAKKLEAIAARADVDLKTARRAAAGEPVAASAALALLAARGYDPVTRKVIAPRRVGRIDHDFLGLGVRGKMIVNGHTVRAAAAAMGTSVRTVDALRKGSRVAIASVLKACTYLGVHPFEQCDRVKEAA